MTMTGTLRSHCTGGAVPANLAVFVSHVLPTAERRSNALFASLAFTVHLISAHVLGHLLAALRTGTLAVLCIVSTFFVIPFANAEQTGQIFLGCDTMNNEKENYEIGKRHMKPTSTNAFAWYAFGTATACIGKYEEALQYFKHSFRNGFPPSGYLLYAYYASGQSFDYPKPDEGLNHFIANFAQAIHYLNETAGMIEEENDYPKYTYPEDTKIMENQEKHAFSVRVFFGLVNSYLIAFRFALEDISSEHYKKDALKFVRGMSISAQRCLDIISMRLSDYWEINHPNVTNNLQLFCQSIKKFSNIFDINNIPNSLKLYENMRIQDKVELLFPFSLIP